MPVECGDWPQKPAWEWTDRERLDRRFDQNCLAARRLRAGEHTRRDGSCQSSGNITDFVFGTDTPELFLPWQLYDTLLRRVFVAGENFARLQRRIIEDRATSQDLALPDTFWERLALASGDYLALLREQRGMASNLDTASPAERRTFVTEIEKSQRSNCASRQLALSRVRAEFGEGVFNQFLYVAVAPELCSVGHSDRAMFEWVSLGCEGRD